VPVISFYIRRSGKLGVFSMASAVTNYKLLLLCSAGIAAQTAVVMVLGEKSHCIAQILGYIALI
jgi:hypothetical protein